MKRFIKCVCFVTVFSCLTFTIFFLLPREIGFKNDVRWIKNQIVRQISILEFGVEKYREKIIGGQLSGKQISKSNFNRIIETSLLPLQIKATRLPEDYPKAGGSLAVVGTNVIIMSRLGDFYVFRGEEFVKLKWKRLPNKIDEYVMGSGAVLNSDSLRASYSAYASKSERLYVGFNRFYNSRSNTLVMASMVIDPKSLVADGEWRDEIETEPVDCYYGSQAGAGRVLVVEDSILFSIGYSEVVTDYRGIETPAAQNPVSMFGKIYKMDLKTRDQSCFSMGHRNVQGLAIDSIGNIYATEHGPHGGDEINLVKGGLNYGWPFKTRGTDYGMYTYTSKWEMPSGMDFVEPLYSFVPSIGISPILHVNGFDPAWNGCFLVGSLKAQSLFKINIYQGRVIVAEPIWIGQRIRDLALVENLGIFILTDESYLIYISVDETLKKNNNKNPGFQGVTALDKCIVCHHFDLSTPASLAPSLTGIVGRKIGGDTFEKYSDGIKNAKGVWDKKNLIEFLLDPQSVVPGTSMPDVGVSRSEATDIVDLLSR